MNQVTTKIEYEIKVGDLVRFKNDPTNGNMIYKVTKISPPKPRTTTTGYYDSRSSVSLKSMLGLFIEHKSVKTLKFSGTWPPYLIKATVLDMCLARQRLDNFIVQETKRLANEG